MCETRKRSNRSVSQGGEQKRSSGLMLTPSRANARNKADDNNSDTTGNSTLDTYLRPLQSPTVPQHQLPYSEEYNAGIILK